LRLRIADLQENQDAATDEHDGPQDCRYLGLSQEQKLLARIVRVAQVSADHLGGRHVLGSWFLKLRRRSPHTTVSGDSWVSPRSCAFQSRSATDHM
jgi:hypothetical protein